MQLNTSYRGQHKQILFILEFYDCFIRVDDCCIFHYTFMLVASVREMFLFIGYTPLFLKSPYYSEIIPDSFRYLLFPI